MRFSLKTIVTALFFLLVASLASAQESRKAFTLTPSKVIAGKPLLIEYCSDSTSLKGAQAISGIIYYWQDYSWHGQDLTLRKNGNVWSAQVDVPNNAALLACKFEAGKKIDKGLRESGYVSFILNPGETPTASSYIGWGLLRGKSTQSYSIPDFITDSANYIGNDIVRFWCNQEMAHSPAEYKNVYFYASQILAEMQPGNVNPAIQKTVDQLVKLDSEGKLSEKDLMRCIGVTRNYLKNDSLANALERRAIEEYPDGILARDKELFRLFRVADPDQKEKELTIFLKRFPAAKFVNISSENTDLYYAKIFQAVIYNQIIKHNNYSLLNEYLHDVPYDMLATFFWHMVQIPYRNKLMTAEKLRPYADLIMNEIMTRPRTIAQEVYAESEWKEKVYSERKEALLAYARILDETGSTPEAFQWMRKLVTLFNNKSAEFSDAYISMLKKTGHESEILPIVKAGVKENAASPEMLDILKKDYIAQKGTEAGFEAYVNSLKSQSGMIAQQTEIKGSLVKQPITLFSLEKINGGTVDMAAMKGKIIVLDFWATWCAPCKAAMPGMQLAVNKYKEDGNVAFFFVSTMETDPKYKEKIREFIKEKGYNFQVLLDGSANGKLPNEMVYTAYSKAFHFSGIPQKMIIDGDGNLRWRSTGYNGSPSALADEISYVIELLKKEKESK